MRVESFSGSPAEWDEFVRTAPGATHCHLHGWRTVMERVFGHECLYYAARDEHGALAAVLPLVRVRSMLFGHYVVSMPFLNYGGPIGTPAGVQALASHVARSAEGETGELGKAKLVELRSRIALPIDISVSHRKITVLLDLPESGGAALWHSLPAKLRSQIRRPQKEGIAVRFGADQVEPFFAVFAQHMRDLGTPTQSRQLFECIAEIFPDDVWFGCAYYGDQAVAAGCGFSWGGEFEMTWASALRRFNRYSPNMLLYWSFLERAATQRLATFNFGRCTPGGATHRFKRQWGSRDVPLWWYQLTPSGSGGAVATPAPDRGALALGPLVWRHLPVALATALGPRIVRYLP
ncbi:MAG TPA: FemAB family XrtA/PEP-CTERM system-associated protein [Gemmatimonadales bacterium]|nr:FemAB family XrtA/PEP-CTERM system-associated protein [Gemmatimonadales bacterium]